MEKQRKNLQDTFTKVRKRIQQYRNRDDRIGEQNTKAALIEPILSCLGWNLEDIEEVSREYRYQTKDNPVDYALFIRREPVLFIEAKALGKNLDDRKWTIQMLSYATAAGLKWCVLTNGDEYRLYNAHAPVDVEQKLFRKFEIAGSKDQEYALNTLELLSKDKMSEKAIATLWKADFVDRRVKTILKTLFENQDKSFVRLLKKMSKELKPSEITESLRRADIEITFPVISENTDIKDDTPAAEPRASAKRQCKFIKKRNGERCRLDALDGEDYCTFHHPSKSKEFKEKRWGESADVADLLRANIIKAPFNLQKHYKDVLVEAVVTETGTVIFEESEYDSLSKAATAVGMSVSNKRISVNGWTFWQYRDKETGRLLKMDILRQRYLSERKESGH